MRFVVVQNDVVINIAIAADATWQPGGGLFAIPSDTANIGDAWTGGTTFVPPTPPSLTQTQLIAYASSIKNALLAKGITVNVAASGAPVNVYADATTNGQTLLSGAVLYVQINPSAVINWVTSTGIIQLTAAKTIALGTGVFAFVQATFTILGNLITQIESGAVTTTAQIDAASWPVAG